MASVFAFGVSVVDFVFQVDELPSKGMKYKAFASQIDGGGMASSAAVAAVRLGGEANLGARIGNDMIGGIIQSELRKYGVGIDFVNVAEGGRSSFSTVVIDKLGERQIVNFSGSELVSDPAWLDDVPSHDAMLVDTSWRPGLLKTLEIARRHDVPGVVDGERKADTDVLSLASHLAFSVQGISALTGEETAYAGLKAATSIFSNWLCVTDGANGTYIARNGSIERIPTTEVKAINTLGAGDVWHGAFVLMLAEGKDEEEAVRFANAAATIRCSRAAGRECYPDRAEVEEFIRSAG